MLKIGRFDVLEPNNGKFVIEDLAMPQDIDLRALQVEENFSNLNQYLSRQVADLLKQFDFPHWQFNHFHYPRTLEDFFYIERLGAKIIRKGLRIVPKKLDELSIEIKCTRDSENPNDFILSIITTGLFKPFADGPDYAMIEYYFIVKNRESNIKRKYSLGKQDNLDNKIRKLRIKLAIWAEISAYATAISTPFGGQPES